MQTDVANEKCADLEEVVNANRGGLCKQCRFRRDG